MAGLSSDDRWRTVIRLAHAAADLPPAGRLIFVQSQSSDPDVIREALALADRLDEPAADSSSRIGLHISRFVLTDYLGRGGMGEVYSARDTQLERTVAIKLLTPAWSGLPGAEDRFTREACIASALNHPNIITIHEVIRSDTVVAIVMERVEGVSLREICGHPAPVPRVVAIGRQVAAALAAAHAAGVVHRDIKPENVMLRPDGRVKVLDFGLARPAPGFSGASYHSAQNTLRAGTWRYMSPEHYRNEQLTSASDMFALGIVLYELSTGRHPFSASSPIETLHAIAVHEPEVPSALNPAIPPTVERVILSALAKDPSDRPTAAALAASLGEHAAADSVVSGRATRRPGWRRRVLAIPLALLAAAGGAVTYLSLHKQTPRFVQITDLLPENRATAAAISPDGSRLVYANIDGIFLRVIAGGDTTHLDGPRDFNVDHLAWLPGGARIIASGFSGETNQPAIWSVSAATGPAREIHPHARLGVPSPDGSRIAFLSDDYSSIWIMASWGEEPRRILKASDEESFPMLLWAPDGRFLIFQRRRGFGNPERSLESVNADTGKIGARLPDVWMESAVAGPDGRILLLRPETAGLPHAKRLWQTRIQSGTGRFTGFLRQADAAAEDGNGRILSLSATADGSRVAAMREMSQGAVFVGEFDPSALRIAGGRRLTLDEKSSYAHAWTGDSGSVIFESDRNGTWEIFRQRITQRVPDLIVGNPREAKVLPQLSPDKRFVLYAQAPSGVPSNAYTLMRVPVDGGPSEQVPSRGPLDEFRCSIGTQGRCVIRTTLNHDKFIYSDLDPVRGIGRELATTSWRHSVLGDWDVSPNGRSLALPNHDSSSALIRVISLDAGSNQPHEREVELSGFSNVSGLTWAADGDAWFVTIDTSTGKEVLYCKVQGGVKRLRKLNGWVVPAPDGKHIAWQATVSETNVWTFDVP